MTKTERLPSQLETKLRAPRSAVSTWSHSSELGSRPTWDDQVSEDALARDAAGWRAADRDDLIALTLWGLPVLAAAIATVLL